MGWTVQDRAAARQLAALAAIIAAVLPAAAGCTAGGPTASSAAPAASGAPASEHWGPAAPVPGLGGRGLNAGGQAWVSSVSCASAGNCAIGGSYRDGHRHGQAYVVSERNGRWGATSCLNGYCLPSAMSCLSTGYCLAGGYYDDYFGQRQAFEVSRA